MWAPGAIQNTSPRSRTPCRAAAERCERGLAGRAGTLAERLGAGPPGRAARPSTLEAMPEATIAKRLILSEDVDVYKVCRSPTRRTSGSNRGGRGDNSTSGSNRGDNSTSGSNRGDNSTSGSNRGDNRKRRRNRALRRVDPAVAEDDRRRGPRHLQTKPFPPRTR